jgi:hypothetical protein
MPRDVSAVGFAHGTPLAGEEVDDLNGWLDQMALGDAVFLP